MGKVGGFLDFDREDRSYEPVALRVTHFNEFVLPLSEDDLNKQAARCIDCSVPYCMGTGSVAPGTPGCPVNNQIPDWNDLVYNRDWETAARKLHDTNNFPEVTGRVCPAPCEASCTLNIDENPVTIKTIECTIADRVIAGAGGVLPPQLPEMKSGKRVAIVGSGPAGLACAQQLARAGHDAHVYERYAKAGGLLRYGIPDFKMEKYHIDRRVAQMQAEGVVFHYGAHVGVNVPMQDLYDNYDALVLAAGCEFPRDLEVPGRELSGIHFAMDFLPQQNRRLSGEPVGAADILATEKHVVVIGGGDTGSDCIGTALRQGALEVSNFEIAERLPDRDPTSWPRRPMIYHSSPSHHEGEETNRLRRTFAVNTLSFFGENGQVKGLQCVEVDKSFKPVAGTEFQIEADLVLLAMGFTNPVHDGMIKSLGVALDKRGNVLADTTDCRTSHESGKIFVAGDMRRGQSLVVWAIREGRNAAKAVDDFIMSQNSGLRNARADYPRGSRERYLATHGL